MKLLELKINKKHTPWVIAFSLLALLSIVAIIVCTIKMPDFFLSYYTKKLATPTNPATREIDKNVNNAMLYTTTTLAITLLISLAVVLTLLFKDNTSEKYFTTKKITYLAVFTAVSYIFYMFIKFNLPIFPSFLDFQISDMPALLAGFMMGPFAGVIVIVLKIALKLPFTSTDFVGEFGDLILGLAFVFPASFIYKFNRTKKGAIIGLVSGSVFCVIMSLFINRFILVPFYAQRFYGGNINGLVRQLQELYSGINEDNFWTYYLGVGVLPFNILRCVLSVVVTFFVYKRCEKLFVKMFGNTRTLKTKASFMVEENSLSQENGDEKLHNISEDSVDKPQKDYFKGIIDA